MQHVRKENGLIFSTKASFERGLLCVLRFVVYSFIIFTPYFFSLQAEVERLVPQVVSKFPHNLPAFTQGLAIEGNELYESCGLYGQSTLRIFDLLAGKVVRRLPLSPDLFAEGIAVFPEKIVQITWKEKQAIVYDRLDLKSKDRLFYSGEGWGLCRDQETVWMSNGTATLIQRNVKTFSPIATLKVHYKGRLLENLNDLECVEKNIYANVWQKDWLVRIDKMTGVVTGIIDGSSLLSDSEKKLLNSDQVLNGIAYRASTETFFITGKEWPWIYEVRFIPQSH